MKTTLIYSTPDYHKLVEFAARRCYDSFDKCGEDSHKLVRGIMKKGHLSIAGHGNIVFTLDSIDNKDQNAILDSLVTFKEINNYIRWSRDPKSKWGFVISMNILTFIDIEKAGVNTPLFRTLYEAVLDVPSLRWFVDKDCQIEGSNNPYLQHDTDLLSPSVLSSDYIALKELGLTDYELDIHTTITVEIVSDRAMSLQDARHSDMMGRSEISQRYVSMSDFQYRVPNSLSNDDIIYSEANGIINVTYADIMGTIAHSYDKIREFAEARGDSQLRAKELARSVLPNAIYSRYIDTRPLRQWKHFFHLRDDKHAQNEKQQDAQALLAAFDKIGVTI